MVLRVKKEELNSLLEAKNIELPKYAGQLLNLANQNSGGTKPKVVGQMSDLIKEFDGLTLEDWRDWYLERKPDAINAAVLKIWPMVKNLKEAINEISEDMVKEWVKDLVIEKTFTGLKIQNVVLITLGDHFKVEYKPSTKDEESKDIDGFIGGKPISIKPYSYKSKPELMRLIDIPIVYYNKTLSGLTIEFDENRISF